jgi:hypothetical protein
MRLRRVTGSAKVNARITLARIGYSRTMRLLVALGLVWGCSTGPSLKPDATADTAMATKAGRPKDRLVLPILIATLQERDKAK